MSRLYEIENEYISFGGDKSGNNCLGMVVYQPKEENPRKEIAVITLHGMSYMGFYPLKELAKRGFTTAGLAIHDHSLAGWMSELDTCIQYLKQYPGIKKVVLMGHSQGGCMASAYQYVAENGTKRFEYTKRILPFPKIKTLTPADGLMLIDANYGIMPVLALDPAVRNKNSGYDRIPELDIFNPENGYVPGGSHYTQEFVARFQKAQIQMYRELLDEAKERYEKIRQGRGMYEDDEPMIIPGGAGGSSNNKPFCMDISLLGRTSEPRPLLHADGSITDQSIVYTVRKPVDSIPSRRYQGGAAVTSVMRLLREEVKFEDGFGYDASRMWGVDGNFNPLSTRENVKYIHVPLLCQGNTGSHEFVNTEFNYEAAVSQDKTIILTEGSGHDFAPIEPIYGDTLKSTCDFFADWLAKPGRFME